MPAVILEDYPANREAEGDATQPDMRTHKSDYPKQEPTRGLLLAGLLGMVLAVVAGCGVGGSGGGGGSSTGDTSLLVNVGDADADQVIAFAITIDTVTLNGGGSILALPTRVELRRLSATFQPLSLTATTPGTYNGATITVSSPKVTFVDAATGQVLERNATLTTSTANVTFNPAFTLGSSPAALNFDLDMAATVNIDGANNVTVTPTFSATSAAIAAQASQVESTGQIDSVVGSISGTPGATSFQMTARQTSPTLLTFVTDANTVFNGVAGLGGLSAGGIVEVDAVTRSDGSLLATRVNADILMGPGLGVEGVISSVTGGPPSAFAMMVQSTATEGVTLPALGTAMDVTLSGLGVTFDSDSQGVDLTNLPFNVAFERSTLTLGQAVLAATDTPDFSAITTTKIRLQQQAVTGVISGLTTVGSQSIFTLTPPADSAFVKLTGFSTLTAYSQPTTDVQGVTLQNGATVRVRGLLLFDGVTAFPVPATFTYQLVASRITAP